MEYFAYGKTVQSDIDLGRALSSGVSPRPDILLLEAADQRFDDEFPFTSGDLDIHGRRVRFSTTRDSGFIEPGLPWKIVIDDVLCFTRVADTNTIHYRFIDERRVDLLAFWFAHIALPVHLTLDKQHMVLHASSVAVNRQALLFLGNSNAGKSTMAAAFLASGHPLLSDDKLAVRISGSRFLAEPSHNNIRPYRSYEDLGKKAAVFNEKACPISAVYMLERGPPDAKIVIERCSGARKFKLLSPHRLYGHLMFAPEQTMAQLGRLADTVELFHVGYPSGLGRLPEVVRCIEAHNDGLPSGS